MTAKMKRRAFITLLGGAVAWPMAARAQQPGGPRRVGLLAPFPDDRDPLVHQYLSAFKQRLHELGWIKTRNIRFDIRFTGQDADRIRTGAEELIALSLNVIVVWAKNRGTSHVCP
jgi:putative tryptophan/tyrosine transport system substrate-binding protein